MIALTRAATRRFLAIAAITTGVLGVAATATARPDTTPVTLASASSSLDTATALHLAFCPFGKSHKHGRSCRFGSVKNLAKPAQRCFEGGAATGAGLGTLTGPEGAAPGAMIDTAGGCSLALTRH